MKIDREYGVNPEEQIIFVMVGASGTGKSSYANMLRRYFGFVQFWPKYADKKDPIRLLKDAKQCIQDTPRAVIDGFNIIDSKTMAVFKEMKNVIFLNLDPMMKQGIIEKDGNNIFIAGTGGVAFHFNHSEFLYSVIKTALDIVS